VKTTRATLLAVAAVAVVPAAANAATVWPYQNGGHADVKIGDSLTINLKPGNSGSTGYHWQFTRKPSGKILRLTSNHAASGGRRQVLRYNVRGAGITSLKLRYRPPGKGKSVKTFRLAVLANEQEPSLDCGGSPLYARSSLVARSGTAVVFKLRRTLYFWDSRPERADYDVYYGCELSQDHAFPLGGATDRTRPHEFSNVTLRGNVVAYAHDVRCPFDDRAGCPDHPASVESQDLHTGHLIRSVDLGIDNRGANDTIAGLVESPSGGIAWIERGAGPEGPTSTIVYRSDAAAASGEPYAHDATLLDGPDDGVDPDSLMFDGTHLIWTRDGTQQEAPLH
jgi:predicted secreted protein